MTLEVIKTTHLVGNLKIEETLVKQYVVDIDENGISTINEYVHNPDLYTKNRVEMRKQEAEFRDKCYQIEDTILANLSKETSEQP
nr:MAG TPA: Transcription factor subunit Med10 of Mediator complex [Caudoviricetes sp.]